jgi:two-component system, LytTR family, sensor kinase
MNINLFRRIESWGVPALLLTTLSVFLYESYKKYGDILYNIEATEERRIAALYDWWGNAFWPLTITAIVIYVCWLLISNLLNQNYWHENRRKLWIQSVCILGLIGLGAVCYLSLWKDIEFRYIVDYCMNADYKSWIERKIIGAKVRSPFRLLNIALLSASMVVSLALYVVVSQMFKWAIQRPQDDDSVNTKIIHDGSALAMILWVLCILNLNFLLHRSLENIIAVTLVAFGHVYLFHYRLVRIPAKNERPDFWKLWKKGLLYLFVASLAFVLILNISYKLANSYNGNYRYYSEYVWERSFKSILENGFFILVFSVGITLIRQLATKPITIRFRRNQAELAGLRAQVNPHFLFNALNTLYSTALTEEASRTSQGIQKLSDMMRFMLHENNKETIDIRQEVNYLRNYIDLQTLRIAESENFDLNVKLDDTLCLRNIAPMLLVPFVENAFKHGISMRQKSWIDIKLHCDGNSLYFSVFNSVHQRTNEDPERNASGIGLENVKKRLELLYPKNHNLTIHQTEREFSINLVIGGLR